MSVYYCVFAHHLLSVLQSCFPADIKFHVLDLGDKDFNDWSFNQKPEPTEIILYKQNLESQHNHNTKGLNCFEIEQDLPHFVRKMVIVDNKIWTATLWNVHPLNSRPNGVIFRSQLIHSTEAYINFGIWKNV